MCDESLQRSISLEDMMVVVSLPGEIPENKYSTNLAHYVNQKHQNHEDLIQKMHEEIEQLNVNIDTQIELYLNEVKSEVELIRKELLDCAMVSDIKDKQEWSVVSDKSFKLKLQFQAALDDYSLTLKSLEKKRAETTGSILSKYKMEANTLKGVSTETIEIIFEDIIKDINRKALTFFQKHEDTKLYLEVDVVEIINKFQEYLKDQATAIAEKEANYLWQKVMEDSRKKFVVKAIFNLNQENYKAREEFSVITNDLTKALSDLSEDLKPPTDYNITGDNWIDWIGRLNPSLDNLNVLCESVEGILKTAINTQRENFNINIDKLSRTLLAKYQEAESNDNIIQLFDELKHLKRCQDEELQHLQDSWQNIINLLNSKVEYSKTFMSGLVSIWMNHLSRIKDINKELETQLASSHEDCIKLDKNKNTKIKNQTKAVREAKDLEKLEKSLEVLEDALNNLTDTWEENYETQLNMVEDVRRSAIEILIHGQKSEIDQFLNVKYPKQDSSNIYNHNQGDKDEMYKDEIDQIDQVSICNIYMNAVDNRLIGIYEMMKQYYNNCEPSIRDEAEELLNTYTQNIVDEYENRLGDLYETHKKIINEIKVIRSAELEIHTERLLSHTSGARLVLSQLNQQYEEIESKQRSLLSEFNEKLTTVNEELSTKTLKEVKSSILELEQEWSLLTESLENNIKQANTYCENQFGRIKQSNSLFLKTAKNFKNGGNYSPEELKTLNKGLKEVERTTKIKQNTLFNDYNTLLRSISKQPLNSTIEKLTEKLSKLTLHDNILNTLNGLKIRLKSEMSNLDRKGKYILNKIKHLNPHEMIDIQLIQEITKVMDEMHNYMKFPVGVLALENTKKDPDSITTTPSVPVKSDKEQAIKTSEIFQNMTDDISEEENNFLARTKGIVLKTHKSLLESVRETFKMKPDVNVQKKKEIKQDPQFELASEYINSLNSTLKSYNMECERVWFQQVVEFLSQITYVRVTTASLIQEELDRVHTPYMASLISLEKDYLQRVYKEMEEGESKRKKTRQGLKLPLAHPTHQHKLEALHKQAMDLKDILKETSRDHLTAYKDTLQNKHVEYVQQVKALKEHLNEILISVFDENSFNELFQDIETITSFTAYTDEADDEIISEEAERRIELPALWSEEDLYHKRFSMRSHSVPSDFKSKINEVVNSVKPCLLKIATEKIKASAEKIQQLYDAARNRQKTYEETVSNWLKSFETNMKQAKQYYKPLCK